MARHERFGTKLRSCSLATPLRSGYVHRFTLQRGVHPTLYPPGRLGRRVPAGRADKAAHTQRHTRYSGANVAVKLSSEPDPQRVDELAIIVGDTQTSKRVAVSGTAWSSNRASTAKHWLAGSRQQWRRHRHACPRCLHRRLVPQPRQWWRRQRSRHLHRPQQRSPLALPLQ